MTRIIKFRAWDMLTPIMMYFTFTDLLRNSVNLHYGSCDWELMQYTGLKDKNGKEIYEGDIVKGYRPATEYLKQKDWVGIIEFAKVRCAFVVRVKHLDGIDTFDNIVSCDSNYQVDSETLTDYQYQVIGNIYENPELLKP